MLPPLVAALDPANGDFDRRVNSLFRLAPRTIAFVLVKSQTITRRVKTQVSFALGTIALLCCWYEGNLTKNLRRDKTSYDINKGSRATDGAE